MGRLHEAGRLDRGRASLDGASVRPRKGARDRPEPDESRQARRQAPPCRRCARHTPGLTFTGANRHDGVMTAPTLDTIPLVRSGRRGRRRRLPHKLHADEAYDARARRQEGRAHGIVPHIVRRRPVRHERRADIDQAFTTLAACLITLNQIRRFCSALLTSSVWRIRSA